MHTEFQSETPKERGHLGAPGVDKGIILKRVLNKEGISEWNGFMLLATKISGRPCDLLVP